MKGLKALYSWRYPFTLTTVLQSQKYHMEAFWRIFWHANDLDEVARQTSLPATKLSKALITILFIGIGLELVVGVWLIVLWWTGDVVAGWEFGLALIIGYPLFWAHLIAIPVWASYLFRPKYTGKQIICALLESQVRALRHKHTFTVVAVVGSVGKTSTKMAIAKTLSADKRVLWQEGNYNDRATVPLVFFEQTLPGLFNIPAWLRIYAANRHRIAKPYPYDVVVVELGTDGPGQIAEFAYLEPDIVVVTALSPEHMEYFGTVDAVAVEELSALSYAKQALVNIDDSPEVYLADRRYQSYGMDQKADYHIVKRRALGSKGQRLTLRLHDDHVFDATISLLGEPGAKMAIAAAAVAHIAGLSHADIKKGLQTIEAFAGRMQILPGVRESTIIDDTYNATPIAVKAALDVLYAIKAPERIAILGSMNELGDYSYAAHQEVGAYCDPDKLSVVVTIGKDANDTLAAAAKKRGCSVKTFDSPYAAGKYVQKRLKQGAVVLAKGSQNGVFAEEAVKLLLADSDDAAKLVRQSDYWMSAKRQQFTDAGQ